MKIYTIGGFNEVGKNMTAIKVGDDSVVIDMGFFLPALIDFEEDGGDRKTISSDGLIKMGAIPNDKVIDSWRKSTARPP